MQNIFNFLIINSIKEPPFEYDFLYNLPKSEYPKYLAKIFNYRTGEKLPLKWDFKNRAWIIDKNKCKTFNQKVQWIKLYGVTPLMRNCTDKIKVRDYVKEKIGEEYLKPVLQIIPNESHETMHCHCEQVNDNLGLARQSGDISHDIPDCRVAQMTAAPRNDGESNAVSTYFDKIDFDKLPNSFVIKTNHGCKWQYIIKNKEEFLQNKRLFELVKRNITGWLEQDYCFWGGFELNYRGIKPKILIEALLREEINKPSKEIHVYCFNGKAKYFIKLHNEREITIFNENLKYVDDILCNGDVKVFENLDDYINQTLILKLSEKLSQNFKFVRIDWMIYQNKLYFEEMTFTPYSGFNARLKNKFNVNFGNLIN